VDGLLSDSPAAAVVELSSGNESRDTDSTQSISELSSLSAAAAALCLHSHDSHSAMFMNTSVHKFITHVKGYYKGALIYESAESV